MADHPLASRIPLHWNYVPLPSPLIFRFGVLPRGRTGELTSLEGAAEWQITRWLRGSPCIGTTFLCRPP